MPEPWRSVLTLRVLPSGPVSIRYQRSWTWPASSLPDLGVHPGPHVGRVEAEVPADAEAARTGALAAPLVDRLDAGQLEHFDQVVRGEEAVRQLGGHVTTPFRR
jgi:hypothetical protein